MIDLIITFSIIFVYSVGAFVTHYMANAVLVHNRDNERTIIDDPTVMLSTICWPLMIAFVWYYYRKI